MTIAHQVLDALWALRAEAERNGGDTAYRDFGDLISAAMLHHIETGRHLPGLANFAALLRWAGPGYEEWLITIMRGLRP